MIGITSCKVQMVVNDMTVSATVEGRTLLVHFLRENLKLTGTHVGCDTSQCGCCVVHVDGKAAKSCTMLAVEADGASIRTIEGVANSDGTLSPVQQAFKDMHALQCGYCTPGMIMSATALLQENPEPSMEEIQTYLEGNICRCTGYRNIVQAILIASGRPVDGSAAQSA